MLMQNMQVLCPHNRRRPNTEMKSAEPSASARAQMLERHVRLKLKVGSVSAIALTGAVRMLVLPHAVTTGASLYIEQEYLIAGKLE